MRLALTALVINRIERRGRWPFQSWAVDWTSADNSTGGVVCRRRLIATLREVQEWEHTLAAVASDGSPR